MYHFCECESELCFHHRGCERTAGLADFRVAGIKQTLCPECARNAREFCRRWVYDFDELGRGAS